VAQLVWQGDAEQVNVQVLFVSQTHCPSAHVPEQLLFGSHVTWHGGVWQAKSHELPLPQVHVPFAHTAWQLLLLPLQVAWQGGAVQTNRQSSPVGQVQVPLLQPPTTGLQAAASMSARAAKRPAPARMLIEREIIPSRTRILVAVRRSCAFSDSTRTTSSRVERPGYQETVWPK